MSAVEAALATPGLGWLLIATVLAGLVRGFTGFGTALVFVPMAATVIPPIWVITVYVVMDFIGPLPNLPRAFRDGSPRELLRLCGGMVVGLPLGRWVLARVPVDGCQWTVALRVMALLALLIGGWRYRGPRGGAVPVATGGLSGFLGGSTGMSGPPVILFYMASDLPAATIRGNFMIYFVASNIMMMLTLWLMGHLAATAVMLGLIMTPPFMLANIAGAAMFRPEGETLYRRVAYLLIALAALAGLPVWQ